METIDLNDLYTVPELAARHPRILSESLLRYQLRDRASTGLSRCCVKIGKKVFIAEHLYQTWLAEQVIAQEVA